MADIPAQSLPDALDEYARQTGLQVIYVSEITSGLRSKSATKGSTAQAALAQLLAGTGLQYKFLNAKTVQLLIARPSNPIGNTAGKLQTRSRVQQTREGRPEMLEEVIVSATKREEALSVVAASLGAWTGVRMDESGVKSISELASVTPGVEFDASSQWGSGMLTHIAIRGINSQVGASTTAIYIDDMPIQVRNGQFGNPYPVTFDLARVEVLRGPQGTLFGDSAEGGALRFITKEPNAFPTGGLVRAGFSQTADGSPSYEAGAAIAGPLPGGHVHARVSVWQQVDGGYVNRVDPFNGAIADANANRVTTTALRVALQAPLTNGLQLFPTVSYQSAKTHDSPVFYTYLSDPAEGVFRNGKLLAQPVDDHFATASLRLLAPLPIGELTAVTSYFNRYATAFVDSTNVAGTAFLGGFGNPLGPAYPVSYANAVPTNLILHQDVIAAEARLTSPNAHDVIAWVTGLYLASSSLNEQRATYFLAAPQNPAIATNDSNVDTTFAGFGEADLRLSRHWRTTAGIRVAVTQNEFTEAASGFAFVGVPANTHAVVTEHPITPRWSVAYRPTDSNFLYATIAKGFRIGGINTATPFQCGATPPKSYSSDSLWSYEAGAKNLLLGGRLRVDASVYYMRWRDIQEEVLFGSCGFGYIANADTATSRGFELDSEVLWGSRLHLGLAAAYIDAHYAATTTQGSQIVVEQGTAVGGVPVVASPWSAYGYARYEVPLAYSTSWYVMVEDSVHSHNPGPFTEQNPDSSSYDPALRADPTVNELRLQAGVRRRSIEVRFVVGNVLNTHPVLQQYPDAPGSSLLYAYTVRPRTIGITGTWYFE
jgi:outer membrane receptor protein involved in Fe transport